MDMAQREILRRVRRIDQNVSAVRGQTTPRLGWFWSAVLGLLICALGTQALERGNIPFASDYYELANDYIANNAATAGIAVGDWLGNVDRSTPEIPVSQGQIRGLTSLQTCRLMMTMRGRESSHDYSRRNWAGYGGGYQFGASALATVGLIKASAVKRAHRRVRVGLPPQHIWFLRNKRNWITGSFEQFLRSPRTQDKAFIRLANANIKTGFRSRALNKRRPAQIAGYAAAAHLKGSGAANNWYLRRKNSKDGNGTRTSDYARMGERAINRPNKYCKENTAVTIRKRY